MEWTDVKRGWVYQRKKHLLFSTTWTPKYLVLYSAPIPALAVYEQRSDAMPPYAPLMHLELVEVTVAPAGHAGDKRHWWNQLAEGIGSNIASRKASIVSSLSRRSSVSNISHTKSYKERILDDQGFTVTRQGTEHHSSIKLCFATDSKEERDSWLNEIMRLIDNVNRKNSGPSAPNPVDQLADALSYVQVNDNIAERSASADLSLGCYGLTVIDDKTVKNILKNKIKSNGSDDSIQTSQIFEPASSSSQKQNLIPDDLNLKYHNTLSDCRKTNNDSIKQYLLLQKIVGHFHAAVIQLLKKTIDSLHTTRRTQNHGIIYEDPMVKIQMIADYYRGEEEEIEAANSWIRQEMNAIRWVNGQKEIDVHTSMMTAIDYKGFRVMATTILPISPKSTLVFDLSANDSPLLNETVLGLLKSLAKELQLVQAYPWRLVDGRTVQMALNPSIEVHQIQTSTMANSMVVGKQASKIGGVAATTISPAGYYLLNLNDMIPVWPSVGQNVPESVQNIRPELVLKASGPVSIGSLHPETTMLATKSVLDATINKFVTELESLSLIPLDSMEWTEAFHARGLNAGLMGFVAARAQLPHIQEGLIIEMIARTVKRALRSQLRKAILHFREVQALRVDEELATIALGTVQALLNPPADQGQLQWQCELLEAVSRRYEYGIEYETFKHLPRQALFFAISHHCGLKFREGLNVDSDFIEQSDFIEFLPQINCGGRGPLPKINLEKLTLTEDVMMAEIAERVFPDHEAWNRGLSRASIAKSFGALALYQQQQGKVDDAMKSIRLARCIAPATHSITSQIILNEMQLGMKEDSKLDEISLTFQRALTVTKSHLGAHHPYQLVLSEQFTKGLVGIGSIEALLIALRIRQEILAESTKILGKTHSKTKSQYELIGDLQMRLGTMDEAISSYTESFKYGCGAIAKSQILLKLAKCYEGKEEIEEALVQAQQCRKLVESELPKMIQQDQRQILLALQEEVYETLARLSQNVFSSAINPDCDAEMMMISGAMEGHIKCAIDCYERLFEMQRSRSVESNTQEGERLISLLQSILSLKLKLASPAEKTVIKCARQSKIQVDESVMHDLVVKLLTAPTAPSSFIEKLLIKAGKPETMKEVDEELRAIVQFCGI